MHRAAFRDSAAAIQFEYLVFHMSANTLICDILTKCFVINVVLDKSAAVLLKTKYIFVV